MDLGFEVFCISEFQIEDPGLRSVVDLGLTLTYQILLFCRFPIISLLGSRIGPYKQVGFGRLR